MYTYLKLRSILRHRTWAIFLLMWSTFAVSASWPRGLSFSLVVSSLLLLLTLVDLVRFSVAYDLHFQRLQRHLGDDND